MRLIDLMLPRTGKIIRNNKRTYTVEWHGQFKRERIFKYTVETGGYRDTGRSYKRFKIVP